MKVFLGFSLCVVCIMSCTNSANTSNNAAVPIATKPVNEVGKILFATQCASCHKVNVDMTGPALKNVETRWTDKEKLYAFIKNSTSVIATDAYAKQLFKNYNETVMPPHPDLNNNQIDSILVYIKEMTVPTP